MEMDGGVGVVEEVEEKEKKKEGKTEKEMKEEEINEDEKGEDKRKEKRRRGQMKGEMARRKRQGKKRKIRKYVIAPVTLHRLVASHLWWPMTATWRSVFSPFTFPSFLTRIFGLEQREGSGRTCCCP